MRLQLNTCIVRSWEAADLSSLVTHANNQRIWENLRDRFPHPYTRRDGQTFIRYARAAQPETSFALEVDGVAVGGIGFALQADVERVSSEIGYWVGEAYWGRGICTEALRAVTAYAIERHALTRVFALPFAQNTASRRVLEKAGFVVEGHLRRSAIKNGQILDQVVYGYVPELLIANR